MATVRMKKGDVYADIYDSPEGIARAESHGFVRCNDEKPVQRTEKVENTDEEPVEKPVKATKSKRQ